MKLTSQHKLPKIKPPYITGSSRHLVEINSDLAMIYIKRQFTGFTKEVTLLLVLTPTLADEQLVRVTYTHYGHQRHLSIVPLDNTTLPYYAGAVTANRIPDIYKPIQAFITKNLEDLYLKPAIRAILSRDKDGKVVYAATNYFAEDFNQYVHTELTQLPDEDFTRIIYKDHPYKPLKFIKRFRETMDHQYHSHANDLYIDYAHHLNEAIKTYQTWISDHENKEPLIAILHSPAMA